MGVEIRDNDGFHEFDDADLVYHVRDALTSVSMVKHLNFSLSISFDYVQVS